MSPEIPEQWRAVLERHNLDSIRSFAAHIGVSVETGRRLLQGRGSSRATIEAAAAGLHLSEAQIRALAGEEAADAPFRLPKEADRLSAKQRTVVLSVVGALLDASGRANSLESPDSSSGPSPFNPRVVPPEPNDWAERQAALRHRPREIPHDSQESVWDND